MELWSSAEASDKAPELLTPIQLPIQAAINDALSVSVLASLDIKGIRYVPIVMSEKWRDKFPARSQARHKERVYSCCPQLDYDAFVGGTPAQRIAIYLDGLQDCSAGLKKLGATPQQVAAFEAIVKEVKERLIAEASKDPA
jgi:hypothetical protein